MDAGVASPGEMCFCCYASGRVGGEVCYRGHRRRLSRQSSLLIRWHGLDGPVEVVVIVLRTKVLPDLVGADNDGARGRRLPSWGVVVEYRYPSVHHSGVKARTRLAGSDDGGVFGRRDLLAGIISRSVGRHSLRC
jgi:hypothetical protein